MNDSSFKADVRIKLGGKFKFIIDGGRAFVTSDQYMKTQDESGNINNTYRFHTRSKAANKAVVQRYSQFAIKFGGD